MAAESSSLRRVVVVNQYAVSPEMSGGTRHFELGRELIHHGYETEIVATGWSHARLEWSKPLSLRRWRRTEVVDDVAFQWVWSLPYRRNNWKRYVNMVSFAFMTMISAFLGKKPDVVIGSSPQPFAAVTAWIVACCWRVPFVLEIRDLWPDTLVSMGLRRRFVIWPLRGIERFLYARAQRIIVLTEGIGHALDQKGVEPEKIVFIPNAALRPAPLDPDQRAAERARLGWKDKVVCVYAGAHGPANDLGQITRAARQLAGYDRVHFVLVGDGVSKSSLMAESADLLNVQWMDPVPKNRIGQILRAADIGMLTLQDIPVFRGARPNKIFDYMANGLPIVTTVDGEARVVIEKYGCGIFASSHDEESLGKAILEMSDHADLRCEMGMKGFEVASSTMTREETASILANVLDELMEGEA